MQREIRFRSEEAHHLQFILPKLLLLGLVKEWKVPDMMDEYVAKDGQVRVDWGDFAIIGSKRGTKPLECRCRRQLINLVMDLLREELPFEVY